MSENGIVKCNKCDYKKDYLSVNFYCNKCKEKENGSIPFQLKYRQLIYQLSREGISDDFIDNLLDSLHMQRRKYH